MDDAKKQELIGIALEVRKKAYAPYSKYQVGAALLGKSGRIYSGCNVENASFGATICAERTAAVKAVSEGETSFIALVVATDGSEPGAPCGICRQFLSEFGLDLILILVNLEGKIIETSLRQYLPGAFVQESMNN
jgi:cytidine deaminase, homotetrameric